MAITPFLLFEGKAKEALNFYVNLFNDSSIENIQFQENGQVLHATFKLKGQTIMCIDSVIKHNFTFTPALSLFVSCESEEELRHLYEELSRDGQVLMELGPLPPSKLFSWVNDRFGVSWQLQLL